MKRTFVTLAATLTLAAAFSPPLHASAQGAPATQHVLSRGMVSRPDAVPSSLLHKGNHVVFGRLESVKGALLTLRTRSGHLWSVNATEALNSGNYSAPLFVGKIVEVDGSLGRSNIIQASGVTRMGSLDRRTPADK